MGHLLILWTVLYDFAPTNLRLSNEWAGQDMWGGGGIKQSGQRGSRRGPRAEEERTEPKIATENVAACRGGAF